jgi:hypothetical protein
MTLPFITLNAYYTELPEKKKERKRDKYAYSFPITGYISLLTMVTRVLGTML